MFKQLDIMRSATAMVSHAAARQIVIARNIANSDTPGFRARDIASFEETLKQPDGVALRATRAAHVFGAQPATEYSEKISSDGQHANNRNNVSLEAEMVKASATQSQHDKALAIYASTLNILRTSLGRGR